MGNSFKKLSEGVHLLASDLTWVEGNAITQLQKTAQLPGIKLTVGMPDLHPGRGYPVGAAFWSQSLFYPALVGNDIGCGMALWQTDLRPQDVVLDKLDKRLGNIDNALDSSWQNVIDSVSDVAWPCRASLGTIGGGNHFAELQKVDEMYDVEACAQAGISAQGLQLLVHSGSRGFGEWILRSHIDAHGHRGIDADSAEGLTYLHQHNEALRFARCNRDLIAQRIARQLRMQLNLVLDVHHNFVAPFLVNGESGWLHRKGATPADAGLVVIPGSRGDYSYVVAPHSSAATLNSLPHGAGRKWKRGDCKDRLSSRYRHEQLTRTALGSRVICADRELLYDEAPEAYKSIESILSVMEAEGLLTRIARLKPVLTYKTRGACCE